MTDIICCHCGGAIMLVGELWYLKKFPDINGWCRSSPDDRHSPKGIAA
jgi:hypothetical protein